jgi:heme exporter protein CcmB
MFLWVIQRDLLLAMRQRADVLTTLFFFIIVVSLFPLGVGPEINMLRAMAPGVMWVAALLASMLSLERMFSSDYLDGTLEQMLLSPQPLSLVVLGKVLAHWLVTGVPLVLIAPVLGIQFNLPMDALLVLTASLLLGTPVLSLIGITTGSAFIHSSTNFRCRCCRGELCRFGGQHPFIVARSILIGITSICSMGNGSSIANFNGVKKAILNFNL